MNDTYYNALFTPLFPNNPALDRRTYGKNTLEVHDGTEYRLGGEYILHLANHPFAVRAGFWREPFHSILNKVEDKDLVYILALEADLSTFTDNEVQEVPFFSRSLGSGRSFSLYGDQAKGCYLYFSRIGKTTLKTAKLISLSHHVPKMPEGLRQIEIR